MEGALTIGKGFEFSRGIFNGMGSVFKMKYNAMNYSFHYNPHALET